MAANTYGRQVVVPLTNQSGGGVIAGDVVVIDTTHNDAFTTTTSVGSTLIVGIAQETIANTATGRVLIGGYAALVNVDASVTRGHYGKTQNVAKQATDAGASRGVGTFCIFLTGGTTPDAMLYATDLLGSSLTNPMTTTGDVIYSSDNSGTPARLAVGAAGKFLSGGTTPAWGQGPLTTTGDLLIGATGGTPTRLAVGSGGQGLITDGTTPGWAEVIPWHIYIAAGMITTDAVAQGTWVISNGGATGETSVLYPFYAIGSTANSGQPIFWVNSGPAQNDAFSLNIVLAKGTWDCQMYVRKQSAAGIITLNQDGSSQGTVDTYAATATAAKVAITGWTVTTTGKHVMQWKMATKNASSSNYQLQLASIEFMRTA